MASGAELAIILKMRDEFSKDWKQFSRDLKRGMPSVGDIGAGMTAAITAPILAAGAAVTKIAMDAVESKNLFDVAMGDMAEAGMSFSKKMNQAYKLNETGVRTNLATMYNMMTGMGLTEDAAYGMSEGITKLAYDLASFRNLSIDVAFEKIRSGIVGEMEPLKQLGIIVSDARIQNWALTNGLIKQGQEMTEQQKVIARYNVILEQTKNDTGDLARTIESPSNQLRIMGEQFKTVGEKAGNEFLPMVSEALLWINNQGFPAVLAGMEGFKKGWAETSTESQNQLKMIALALLAGGPLLMGLNYAYKAVTATATAFQVLRIKALAEIAIIAKGFYEITKLNTAVTLMTTQGSESFGDWSLSYGTASAEVDNQIRGMMDSLAQWGLEVVGGTNLAKNLSEALGENADDADTAKTAMAALTGANKIGADAFKAAGGAAQKAGGQTKDAYNEAKQAIDRVKSSMQELANLPLAGTRAADDQIFALQQKAREVELEMLRFQNSGLGQDAMQPRYEEMKQYKQSLEDQIRIRQLELEVAQAPVKRELSKSANPWYQEYTPEQLRFGIDQYAKTAKEIELNYYRGNPQMLPGAGILQATTSGGGSALSSQGGDIAKEMIKGITDGFSANDFAKKVIDTLTDQLKKVKIDMGPWHLSSEGFRLDLTISAPSASSNSSTSGNGGSNNGSQSNSGNRSNYITINVNNGSQQNVLRALRAAGMA